MWRGCSAGRIIQEQKATTIVEHLAYNVLDGMHHVDIFTDKQSGNFITAIPAMRHVYDFVFTDSEIERKFVKELARDAEVVVYAKLPKGFHIPTPVGP